MFDTDSHYQTNSVERSSVDKKQKKSVLLNKISLNEDWKSQKNRKIENRARKKVNSIFLYAYGINTQELKSLIRTFRLPIVVTKEIQSATAILGLANLVKNNRRLRNISHSRKITIHTTHGNSLIQIAGALRTLVKKVTILPSIKKQTIRKTSRIINKELLTPLEETRLAIEEVSIPENKIIDLLPRQSSVRKLQHELIKHYQLRSVSVGADANRRIRIYPN